MLLDLYAWGRVALGAAAIVAPAHVATAFGLGDAPGTRVAARMLGGRDLFMGLGIVLAGRHGASQRGWLEACVAVDSVDALATAEGVRTGTIGREDALKVGGVILASALVGAFLVATVQRKKA